MRLLEEWLCRLCTSFVGTCNSSLFEFSSRGTNEGIFKSIPNNLQVAMLSGFLSFWKDRGLSLLCFTELGTEWFEITDQADALLLSSANALEVGVSRVTATTKLPGSSYMRWMNIWKMKRKKKEIFAIIIEPETGLPRWGQCLLCFVVSGWARLAVTDPTKGSISQAETLSGLGIDACSSHWT